MNDLLKNFCWQVAVESLIGVLVAAFGKSNDEPLCVGNASGIGFLVGVSIGVLIGVFEALISRF